MSEVEKHKGSSEPVPDVEGLVRRDGRLYKPKVAGAPPLTQEEINRVLDEIRRERGTIRDREPGE